MKNKLVLFLLFLSSALLFGRPFTIIDAVHSYNLDPHTANYSSEAQILTGLYEGLFSHDPYSLEPVPALVADYKVSRDKLRWTFTLKEGARFSNGEEITAQTIKDSWLSLLNPATAAPFASLLDCIRGAAEYRTGKGDATEVGISVQSKYQLTLRLVTPTEHLPSILCHHSFSAVHPDRTVYSGPFLLESYDGSQLRMKKNPKYHDAANVALEEVLVIQSDDTLENSYLYNTGAVDWVLSVADIASLIDYNSVLINAEFATEYLFFKSHKAPWNQAAFRNALLAAVPWDVLRGNSFVPATTLIYPIGNYKAPAALADYDLEEAKLLLEQAKSEAGMATDAPLEITIAVSDTDYAKSQAELLMESWSQLGITVHLSITPIQRYLDSISSWDADLFSYTWIGDFADPLAFLELFRSDSTLNESQWHNSEYDRLLQEAAFATGDKRLELLSAAEDVLLSDGLIIPISHPVTLNIIDRQRVKGWYLNALDIHPLKHLYLETVPVSIPNLVLAK
ncbi:MAG: peptide ABC transporter substrate-binding protein [Treponema sp.]|nr:peptide ABC transporter substrate-binding protein [Treponema sp.]